MTTSFNTPRTVSANPFASYLGSSSYYDADSSTVNDPWAASPTGNDSSSSSSSGPLPDESELPAVYREAWRAASSASSSSPNSRGVSTFTASPTISLLTLNGVLSTAAGLSASDTERIINLVAGSASSSSSSNGSPTQSPLKAANGLTTATTRLTRTDFYTALALAALVQQKQAPSIEALVARRSNPPIPILDIPALALGASFPSSEKQSQQQQSSGFSVSPVQSRTHKISLGSQSDPWGAPGSNMPDHKSAGFALPTPSSLGFESTNGASRSNGRSEYSPAKAPNGYSSFNPPRGIPGIPEDSNSSEQDPFLPFDPASRNSNNSGQSTQGLPPFSSSQDFSNCLERISVFQQPELAGNFLTRHTVYRVVSESSGSSSRKRNNASSGSGSVGGEEGVLRRYSDWIWLNEVLEQKYPARIRIGLPPKRVGISARHLHIASDEVFLERRRKSLARYLEFVANHHIMKNDRFVRVFLTEPQDLSIWRKANPDLDLSDETHTLRVSSEQLSSIPTTFESSTLVTLRETLPTLIDSLSRFCALLERIHNRNLSNASDLMRAKMAFDSFGEIYSGLSTGNGNGHSGRPKEIEEECIILNRDMKRFSHVLGETAELSESREAGFGSEELERLKFGREVWRGLMVLLVAYETRLKHDSVDKIKKRMEASQNRYKTLSSTAQEARKPNHSEELAKLINGIEGDQDLVEKALGRRETLRYCLAQEIRNAWRWSTVLRVGLADWSKAENEHQQRLARIWNSLESALAI